MVECNILSARDLCRSGGVHGGRNCGVGWWSTRVVGEGRRGRSVNHARGEGRSWIINGRFVALLADV